MSMASSPDRKGGENTRSKLTQLKPSSLVLDGPRRSLTTIWPAKFHFFLVASGTSIALLPFGQRLSFV
jgi:hypothetical protein